MESKEIIKVYEDSLYIVYASPENIETDMCGNRILKKYKLEMKGGWCEGVPFPAEK